MPKRIEAPYLEKGEVRTIIEAIPLVSRHIERDVLLIELLWQSGARLTEALELKSGMISSTSVRLRNLKQVKQIINVGRRKKKFIYDQDATKDVEITPQLCQNLVDFCKKNKIDIGEYVFRPNSSSARVVKHLNRQYVWGLLGKASELVNIRKQGKKHPKTGGRAKGAWPHILRHSNAMLLLEETGDIDLVSQQLGHSNIETTRRYAYTKRPKIRKIVASIDW